MTTELVSKTTPIDATSEQARRAVKAFRAMQPGLTAYARALSRKPDVRVELTAGEIATNGRVIYFRPPMRLGDPTQHDRKLCDKRDAVTLQQLCPACNVREEVLASIYHELAHIIFDSFAPVKESDKIDMTRRALAEGGGRFAKALEERYLAAPGHLRGSYKFVASLFSPFLPQIVNALEDARVNREMFAARPGTKLMFEATERAIFTKGVEQMNEEGQLVTIEWRDYPRNLQVIVGLFCKATGYDYEGWFHADVERDLGDPGLTTVVNSMATVRDASAVYNLSFKALDRLRELGYCQSEIDPEPEPEPEPDPEPDTEEEPDDGNMDAEQDEPESDESDPGDGDSPGDDADEGADTESEQPDPGQGEGDGADGDEAEGDGDEDGTSPGQGPGEETEGSDPSDEGPAQGSGGGDLSGGDEGDQQPEQGDDADSSPADAGADADGDEVGGPADDQPGSGDDAGNPTDEPDATSGGGGSPTSDTDEAGSDDGDVAEGDSDGSRQDDAEGDEGAEPDDGLVGSEPVGAGDSPEGSESGDTGDDAEQGADADPSVGRPAGGRDEGEVGDDEGLPDGDGLDAGEHDQADRGDDDRQGGAEAPADTTAEAGDSFGDDGDDSSHSPDDLGGEDDGPDGEPIDTGADQGLGGVKVEEPDYGTADDIADDLAKWLGHEAKPDEEVVQAEADDREVVKAILQGMYFETPSADVAGVRERHYGDDAAVDGIELTSAWKPNQTLVKLYGKAALGISGDFTPPESILGGALLRMRVAFSDNMRANHQRNRKSGRVDARVLGKRAAVGDERLFHKRIVPGKRDYFVVIGMDVSGSNVGENIMLLKRAVMAQATLLHRAGIKFAIVAHSASYFNPRDASDGFCLDVYHVKDADEPWDDKVKRRLEELAPDQGNLDGHALEYLRKVADADMATDKVILYYSDGKMPALNEEEELVILQREIATCKRKQITLLGVGIRTDSPSRHGLDTVQVDDDNDLVKVVRHIERNLIHAGPQGVR